MQKELTMKKACQSGVVCVCLLLITACGRVSEQKPALQPIPVRVQVVTAGVATSPSRYVGTVEAVRETPLSVQTGGRVLSVHVKDGEYVKKGQVLLCVDSAQALNAVRSTQAVYEQAKDGYERAKQVYDKGAVTDQKMVEIESQYTQARSLYDAARQQLGECTLRAPQDGVISGWKIQPGQSVLPAIRIGVILDLSAYQVLFTVPETEIGMVTIGQRGEMDCAAVGKSYEIQVTEKSMKADPVAHTYTVSARVSGTTDSRLMPGMVAKCRLDGHTNAQQENIEIVIPNRCVLLTKNGPTVWIAADGKAERRAIRTGRYKSDGVEVTDGLHAGDTLIIDGYQKLYNGCKLRIQ